MRQCAIIYWSGTGNTETMAGCIAQGVREAGADAVLLAPSEVSAAGIDGFDTVAFGCPAMGAEVLEEAEFEPMFAALEGSLHGRKIALFGSYGWGDGQWMRDWCDRCRQAGASLVRDEGLIANGEPDEAAQEACRDLGKELASL